VQKPDQAAVFDEPEGGVPGVHQLASRLEGVPQDLVQIDRRADRLVGPQQPPQPSLGRLNVLSSRDELLEELVELEPGGVREAAGFRRQ
jgi:hypothetical protein